MVDTVVTYSYFYIHLGQVRYLYIKQRRLCVWILNQRWNTAKEEKSKKGTRFQWTHVNKIYEVTDIILIIQTCAFVRRRQCS